MGLWVMKSEQKIRVFPVAMGEGREYSGFYTHGLLLAYIKAFNNGALNSSFEFDRIAPITLEDMKSRLEAVAVDTRPVVFLLSSYIWNHKSNIEFAKKAREIVPNCLMVIGGPHIPKNEERRTKNGSGILC